MWCEDLLLQTALSTGGDGVFILSCFPKSLQSENDLDCLTDGVANALVRTCHDAYSSVWHGVDEI